VAEPVPPKHLAKKNAAKAAFFLQPDRQLSANEVDVVQFWLERVTLNSL